MKERRIIVNRRREIVKLREKVNHEWNRGDMVRSDLETASHLLMLAVQRLDKAASFDNGNGWEARCAYYDAKAFIEAARCIVEPERAE